MTRKEKNQEQYNSMTKVPELINAIRAECSLEEKEGSMRLERNELVHILSFIQGIKAITNKG